MRELFPGYYRLTEKDISVLWEEGMFILDTNVLLYLYRAPKELHDGLMRILRKLSNQDRLWIPFQVALEYQENRPGVIGTQLSKYRNAEKVLTNSKNSIKSWLEQLQLGKESYSIEPDGLMEEIDSFFEKIRPKMEKLALERLDVSEDDELEDKYAKLRDDIDQVLEGKVGLPPVSQQWLDDIYEEGERRYKLKIPPGYKDGKKKEGLYVYGGLVFHRKYGDLVLWHQIIEEAKAHQEKFNHVVFITDEKKDDWWSEKDGNITGPRHKLVTEISSKAGVSLFHMYRSDRFIELGKKYLKVQVNKKAIDQARDISSMPLSATFAPLPSSYLRAVKQLAAVEPLPSSYLRAVKQLIEAESLPSVPLSFLRDLEQQQWAVSSVPASILRDLGQVRRTASSLSRFFEQLAESEQRFVELTKTNTVPPNVLDVNTEEASDSVDADDEDEEAT